MAIKSHEATTADKKKAIHRSLRYPGMSLEDAIERVRIVYENEKRTPASGEVIVGHFGLKAGTGPANRVISALRQYGLLENRGEQLRVSDSAFKILHLSDDSPERIQAVREASRKPIIIQDVISAFPEGLPSDANLRNFLIQQKNFNPDSIEFFIRVLRKNLSLAPLDPSEYTDGSEEPVHVEPVHQDAIRRDPSAGKPPIAGEQERLRFSLSGDRTVRLIFGGPQPTQAEIDELMDYLKISRRTFPPAEPSVAVKVGPHLAREERADE